MRRLDSRRRLMRVLVQESKNRRAGMVQTCGFGRTGSPGAVAARPAVWTPVQRGIARARGLKPPRFFVCRARPGAAKVLEMIANYRSEIARVAEETVANLKGLETQIEVLRNGLAWLCQSIGQPDAARWALMPSRGISTAGGAYGVSGALSNLPFGPIPTMAPQVPQTSVLPPSYALPGGFVAQAPYAYATVPAVGLPYFNGTQWVNPFPTPYPANQIGF